MGISFWLTKEGGIRSLYRVQPKSKVVKNLLGFPAWIEEIDVSVVIANIVFETGIFTMILGWFVLDDVKKKIFVDKYAHIALIIALLYLVWVITLIMSLGKEVKEKSYFRETVDLIEKKDEIIFGSQGQYKYEYIYARSKRLEEPRKVIVFLPESYHMNEDVDGNVYLYSSKGGYQKNSNVGAYEELSDFFVRDGYATLRCARKLDIENIQADGKNIGQFINQVLQQIGFEGEIIVLAHGPNHRRLKNVCDELKPSGIVSLCGAGLGLWEELIHKEIWQGKNPERVHKKYMAQRTRAIKSPSLSSEIAYILQMTQEQWIQEFLSLARDLPVFLGYVECDPYYDEQIVDEIRKNNMENIVIHKFENTDFTLRLKNKNQKNGVRVNGHIIEPRMSRINPVVAEKICEWIQSI